MNIRLNQRIQSGDEFFILGRGCPVPFRLTPFVNELIDGIDDGLHLLMAENHRTEHNVFRQNIRFRLDHQYGRLCTGDNEIKATILKLRLGRIEYVLVIDVTHARSANRSIERNTGNRQRRRSTDHCRDVRIDLRVE